MVEVRLVDNIQRWVLAASAAAVGGAGLALLLAWPRAACACAWVLCAAPRSACALECVLSRRAGRGHAGCGLPVSRGVAVFVWRVSSRLGRPD